MENDQNHHYEHEREVVRFIHYLQENQIDASPLLENIGDLRNSYRLRLSYQMLIAGVDMPELSAHFQVYRAAYTAQVSQLLDALKETDTIPLPEGVRLRPKQVRFMRKVREFFSREPQPRSGFVKYPTGIGKTWLIGLMLRAVLHHTDAKALVLSPRNEINNQNLATIDKLVDGENKVKMIHDTAPGETQAQITIATYSMDAREANAEASGYFGDYQVIFLDETHRAFGTKTLEFLRDTYPNAIMIGLSATPYIGAGSNPKNVKTAFDYFEGEIDSISLLEACQDGDLAPIRAMQIKVSNEDFKNAETDRGMRENLNLEARNEIAKEICKNHIPDTERGLVFCDGIEHAEECAKNMQADGIRAEFTHGLDPKRGQKLAAFKRGEIQILCNSDLLIEGYDDPSLSHVIMLRPTLSLWIYEQIIGRAARIDSNNPDKVATIWDVVGQHSKQCTIFGLSEFYEQQKSAYLNGEIAFGPEDNPGIGGTQPIAKPNFGVWGEFEDVIAIEEVGQVFTPRDRLYYENPENLRQDLDSYTAANSDLSHARQLNLSSRRAGIAVKCNNGEVVKFTNYLAYAALAFGFTETYNEAVKAPHPQNALKRLKEIAGYDYVPRNEAYFLDAKRVHQDLERFAEAAGLEDGSLLTTAKTTSQLITCSNGDRIRWMGYLYSAKKALGLNSNAETLKNLKLLAGYALPAEPLIKRDAKYYKNLDHLRADLEAFTTAAGLNNPTELTSSQLTTAITLKSNESVPLGTYVKQASRALGLSLQTETASESLLTGIHNLVARAGYERKTLEIKRDAEYYQNPEYVRTDLEAFARQAELNSPEELSNQSRLRSITITCSNTEENVSYLAYLQEAARRLGHSGSRTEKRKRALRALKLLIGIELPPEPEPILFKRDRSYYENPEYIRADLEAFAQLAGVQSGQKLLSTAAHKKTQARCSNNEIVRFERYVKNAGVKLGLVANSTEASGQQKMILSHLKKIAYNQGA